MKYFFIFPQASIVGKPWTAVPLSLIPSLPSLSLWHLCLCSYLGRTRERLGWWGGIAKLMGGPEGEFPAPWFANRGLVALSLPCNRGSGLRSSASPPVRGHTKCTVCTVCAPVKARLPSLWRLATGQKGDRGPSLWHKEEAQTPHLWLFSRTDSIIIWECGRALKITWSRPNVLFTCGRPTMEMQRWSSRWKTKRWFMDSTITAVITFTLILQATSIRAGKIIRDESEL